ncbi:MAG: DUF2292 domain-containing protein [Treponema sp.]|jgi:hypothetical protein|nr:DUF2292 domain-containing protein [Treponema sp.]
MQEIVEKLERNLKEIRFGTVSVELRIHDGQIVKTVYTTAQTKVEKNTEAKNEH